MQRYEENFIREFRQMVRSRKQDGLRRFRLDAILVPPTSLLKPSVEKKMAIVRGIEHEHFGKLNDGIVELVGRIKLTKREILSDGSVRKDKDGNDMTKPISVPQDSIAVLSSTNIKLPNFKLDEHGERVKVDVPEGFMYVDYIENNGVYKFIYIIPREYVYLLNLNALIITPNKRRNYYEGYRILLQDGNYMYIYVIPYNPREYIGVRLLGAKAGLDFTAELTKLIQTWRSHKIMFEPHLTIHPQGYNMGYNIESPTLYKEDYVPFKLSIKEEKEIEF